MTSLRPVLLALVLLMLGACATSSKTRIAPEMALKPARFQTEKNHWPNPGQHTLDFLEIYDPWEPLNRNLYSFNAGVDEYFVLPATGVYETVIPSPARKGVSNVIQNANEVGTLVNCILQGKLKKGAVTTSRFVINTSFGVLGMFDLASNNENLQLQKEDFGQTFGVWGLGAGPYFVMPILGPSNLRDTAGFGADFLWLIAEMKYAYKLLGVKNTRAVGYTELILRSLNRRSSTPFRYYSTGSPFEYELVRFVYTLQRELEIKR